LEILELALTVDSLIELQVMMLNVTSFVMEPAGDRREPFDGTWEISCRWSRMTRRISSERSEIVTAMLKFRMLF